MHAGLDLRALETPRALPALPAQLPARARGWHLLAHTGEVKQAWTHPQSSELGNAGTQTLLGDVPILQLSGDRRHDMSLKSEVGARGVVEGETEKGWRVSLGDP